MYSYVLRRASKDPSDVAAWAKLPRLNKPTIINERIKTVIERGLFTYEPFINCPTLIENNDSRY